MVQKMELYYNIKKNIFQNFENENRNYETLSNLITISKDDYTIRDMNEIINEVNDNKKFDYIIKIYKKIIGQIFNYDQKEEDPKRTIDQISKLIKNDDVNQYSYECLNIKQLSTYLYEGIPECRIQIILRNNGKSPWPMNNSKLIFDEFGDFKAEDVILKPQKPGEQELYEIVFKGLSVYPVNEYN